MGRVCLVGAGPGDPGLITVKGLQRLAMADVVVFDALIDSSLLDHAPANALRIDAGKRAKLHKLTQDQTNQLLAEHALAGKFVVRLKGGDPYLFGRGAEEASYLAARGIEVEIIPGVTAGIAAPAAAGIPVTHRELASTVTFVTGHEDPTKADTAVDYAALAKLIVVGGTVCFYMGVGRLDAISRELQSHALPASTPVAVVQWGTLPRQRSVRTTLEHAQRDVVSAGIGAPAIIVVGPVAAIDDPGLNFFTHRPLFGKRILVTRTRQQVSELREKLTQLGADVLEAATIELVEPDPATLAQVNQTLRDIREYDWLILTSANAVDAIASRLSHLNLDARHFAGVRIAAIGDTTTAALQSRLRLSADMVPTRFVAESLAGELIAQHDLKGKKCLLLRADIARPALPELLSDAGAIITDLAIYRTKTASSLPANVLEALREKTIDWITFTSSSTATNMVELLGKERDLLQHARIASIGPITSDTLRSLNLRIDVEASIHTIDGLITAIINA